MPDFLISLTGPKGEEHGRLLVDGKQPELFGELVGVNVTRVLPEISQGVRDLAASQRLVIRPSSLPAVEVTLRLPLGPAEQVTILRDGETRSVHGPTGDWVATAPDTAGLAEAVRTKVEINHGWLTADTDMFREGIADELRDALLAVLQMHQNDPATVRAIAAELGIEVDRG